MTATAEFGAPLVILYEIDGREREYLEAVADVFDLTPDELSRRVTIHAVRQCVRGLLELQQRLGAEELRRQLRARRERHSEGGLDA